jgi:malonate transporter
MAGCLGLRHGWYSRRVNFFQLLFPDFSLILIGYLVCRFTPLQPPGVGAGGATGLFSVLSRSLLFQSIVKSPLDIRRRQQSGRGCRLAAGTQWHRA